MKTDLAGYTCPSLNHLRELSDTVEAPQLIFDRHCWALPIPTTLQNTLDIVNTNVGQFQFIPVNSDNSRHYSISNITTNNQSTELDFRLLNRILQIDLQTNTSLVLSNLQRGVTYLLKINFNNYTVENITTLFNLPLDIDWQFFNSNFEYLILSVQFVSTIKLSVLFVKESPGLPPYIPTDNNVAFYTRLLSDILDTGINNYTGNVAGVPTYNDGISLENSRISYTLHNSNLNLNETNFSIEFWMRFKTTTDSGSIISRWTDESRGFFIRVENQTLKSSFNEGATTVNLNYSLANHLNQTLDWCHILITRTGHIYRLFINGVLVSSQKSTNFLHNSSANLVIGKLQNSPATGDVGNSSFSGSLCYLKIYKFVANNYNFPYIFPPNPNTAQVLFLLKNSLTEQVNDIEPSYLSTVTTEDHIILGNRRTFTLGTYSNEAISKKHHFEYDLALPITGDVTIEAWIRNATGNIRGTLIYYGTSTDVSFHFGIFDNYLNFTANNSALNITSTVQIPDAVWNHVAFVRKGTANRLYLNGMYIGGTTSSEPLNSFAGARVYIKRAPNQSSTEASLNTVLYPSKSLIDIDSLRITSLALYDGISPTYNYNIPGELK